VGYIDALEMHALEVLVDERGETQFQTAKSNILTMYRSFGLQPNSPIKGRSVIWFLVSLVIINTSYVWVSPSILKSYDIK
jgi:hypothetical protein